MKSTTFDRKLWNLSSFEKVSYNKCNQIFTVYFHNGSQIDFSEVTEETVFQFVISIDKENYLQSHLLVNFPYIQYTTRVSKLS
ncbi:KTSC domain-containing protein [Aquibacillus salsiterrae]|uniref:KTSC domain-containing protein n=1 Tax=Aquibacillus salsiterrae TaxID=2950439 RepID=A0A9X3WEJ6_9BACI|nr:KTSC domain-containing protein [Aquibacillus salsiterrae]MDC3415606.1 KTSC domain-containing protein [Aquibacillus salsiterrae]